MGTLSVGEERAGQQPPYFSRVWRMLPGKQSSIWENRPFPRLGLTKFIRKKDKNGGGGKYNCYKQDNFPQ
ncbi:MAG: hypothetical protein Fur0025_24830 [Oscillatoriaceae cyanobacterium]